MRRIISSTVAVLLCVLVLVQGTRISSVYGLSPDDAKSLGGSSELYWPKQTGCQTGTDSSTGTTTVSSTASETAIAQIIIGIAKTDNIGQQGALIGLMAGLVESNLKNEANTNVPVSLTNPAMQGVGSDHDSVGVFQQRPSTGWSTIATGPAADSNQAAVWQLMDPAYAAEAFFGSPPGSKAPSALSKGVQNKPGWQTQSPGAVAQAVQGSANPSAYGARQAQAQSLVNQNWSNSPAIALPVPITGGSSGTGGGTINASVSSCAATTPPPASGTYQNPFPGGWKPGRLDLGYDGHFTGQIVSPCDGQMTYVDTDSNHSDNGGWKGAYFIVQCTQTISGLPSNAFYFAEGVSPTVSQGQGVTAGQQIGVPGWTGYSEGPGGIEWGLAVAKNPRLTVASSLGNSCTVGSASQKFVMSFSQWVQQNLHVAAPKTTDHAGCA